MPLGAQARKKKRFIDKKNAVTFNLVHRSQHDPLQADDAAPKHVLVEVGAAAVPSDQARREEQVKFGVYFDDDYNYLQHLRDVRELCQSEPMEVTRVPAAAARDSKASKSIVLPSSVFETDVETREGLMNKGQGLRGPQPDWDPDVVAALDDDFDHDNPENELDDDFISQAMMGDAPCDDEDNEEEDDDGGWVTDDDLASDEAQDAFGSDFDGDDFNEDDPCFYETRTAKFTEYSMTSSVCPRSEALTLVDDRFEHLMIDYDELEVGALDQDEIEGQRDDSAALLDAVLRQYEAQKDKERMHLPQLLQHQHVKRMLDRDLDEKDKTTELEFDEKPNAAQWDCESILSTYSTCYNHPTVIEDQRRVRRNNAANSAQHIELTKRVALLAGSLAPRGPTRAQRERGGETAPARPFAAVPRAPGEDAQQRRARKQAVKDERRLRREEKKATKQVYKQEEHKQRRDIQNVQQALRGTHID